MFTNYLIKAFNEPLDKETAYKILYVVIFNYKEFASIQVEIYCIIWMHCVKCLEQYN